MTHARQDHEAQAKKDQEKGKKGLLKRAMLKARKDNELAKEGPCVTKSTNTLQHLHA